MQSQKGAQHRARGVMVGPRPMLPFSSLSFSQQSPKPGYSECGSLASGVSSHWGTLRNTEASAPTDVLTRILCLTRDPETRLHRHAAVSLLCRGCWGRSTVFSVPFLWPVFRLPTKNFQNSVRLGHEGPRDARMFLLSPWCLSPFPSTSSALPRGRWTECLNVDFHLGSFSPPSPIMKPDPPSA